VLCSGCFCAVQPPLRLWYLALGSCRRTTRCLWGGHPAAVSVLALLTLLCCALPRCAAAGQEAKEHLSKLATMSDFVWRQAVGLPTGPHAAFQSVGADAVTLRLTSEVRWAARVLFNRAAPVQCL
jgi:hypothetical protein